MARADASRPEVGPEPDHGFAEAWAVADRIPGWLKSGQARLLHDEARRLAPGAHVLEIGSHQGRSTVVLAKAVAPLGGRVTCVDPFVEGPLFGGTPTRAKFETNIREAGVADVVDLVPEYSTRLRPSWTEPIDLLYIDGKHDYWTVCDDLRWAAHLPTGGAVVVHDSFSSLGVTLAILRHVLLGSGLAYERRSDSQALFRVRLPTRTDRLRILGELPWWLRNLVLKGLLRLRLRPVARLLGHNSPYDPY
jgi:predicted O-methyltransferase YrrM